MIKDFPQINAIILEGAPFSGKTTFLNYLNVHYPDQFSIIPETGEYVGGDKNFPNLPFRNTEDILYSIFFFSEIEKKRVEDAVFLFKKYGRPIIFDRITPLSSLIFFYLLNEKYFGEMIYTKDSVVLASRYFEKECKNKTFLLPNKIIYLESLNDRVFKQRTKRKTHNKFFENIESYHLICDKYKEFFGLVYPKGFVKMIKTSNTKDSLEEVLSQIEKLVPLQVKPIDYNQFFSKDIWVKNDKTTESKLGQNLKKLDILKIKRVAIKKARELMLAAKCL